MILDTASLFIESKSFSSSRRVEVSTVRSENMILGNERQDLKITNSV